MALAILLFFLFRKEKMGKRLAASLLVAYVFLVMAVTVLARRPFNEFRILPLFWSYIEILRCHPKVGPDDGT